MNWILKIIAFFLAYIHAKLTPAPPAETGYSIKLLAETEVYAGPSTAYDCVGIVRAGDVFEVIAHVDKTDGLVTAAWYKIAGGWIVGAEMAKVAERVN